jgi:AcrR family transcriptional regulator
MISTTRNSERTIKIIHAAAQLFARQGYRGTSTREIARLADMSENTLFRHFEHKEDIFWAALGEGLSGLRPGKHLLDSILECEAPEIVFPKILSTLVEIVSFKPQVLCLMAVAIIELRWKAETICSKHLSPIFAAFTCYLSANIKSGRIRNLDPYMMTAALGMTALVHPYFSRLVSGGPPPHSDNREAIRAYTKFWLDVLVPPTMNRSHSVPETADSSDPARLSIE